MPLARIGGKILFFAHIPKTGGSSIEAYLSRKGSVALKFPRRLGWSKSTAQHMHAEIHRRLIPDGFYDHGFSVVRDPVARMASEFCFPEDRRTKGIDFDHWVADIFARHPERPYDLDNHIRPQHQFLCPGMTVFRFEDGLDKVFDWIDAVTDGVRAERDIWEKKSSSPPVIISPESRRLIETFYAEDMAVIAQLAASPAPMVWGQ